MYTFNCCDILTDQTKLSNSFRNLYYLAPMISILAATIRNQRSLLDLAKNAKEGEWEWDIPNLFIMKRDLESILQPTAGYFADSWMYYGRRRAKTPWGRTKHEESFCKYAFSAERRRRIKRCIEHAILWLSVLSCVQMPWLRKSCYCCSWWQNYWPCISWFGSRWSMG